ncbi:hypothetical protein ABT369_47780 [Dactylosporangium sp. NPDC000244]|uniref:hypothetical protein n=1 Tax=Dactylosporangium sp. NPDC000244 TaxID=3154365 RepID=UPI00331D138D
MTGFLTLDDPEDPLAGTVGDLRYYGRCTCTETCSNPLTAPTGSAGPHLAQLERNGTDVIWLSLNPSGTTVVDIEVLDPSGLDVSLADGEQPPRPPPFGNA